MHVAPPQLAAQLQVLGAVHIPPLAHVGEQTAKEHLITKLVKTLIGTYVLHIEYPSMRLCMYTYYQHYKLLHLNKLASRPLKEARIRIVEIIFLCCGEYLQLKMTVQRTCRAYCTTPIGCTAASIGSSTYTTIGTCW